MNLLQSTNSTQLKSVFYIPLAIIIAKELEILFRMFGWNIASPPDSNWFISNFIEWFGVLYGILLPLILVRAWEQLDTIDRYFDKEADSVRILYKDLFYLSDTTEGLSAIGDDIAKLLRSYVEHVISYHKREIKQSGESTCMVNGDKILEEVREKLKRLINSDKKQAAVSQTLISELFNRLNELVDTRLDRISHASQRLFENLHTVALITSIMFLVPFYFAGLTSIYFLDLVLILGVTVLVIYIYMIIEDLDEPFEGSKKVSDEAWQLLLTEMDKA